MESRRHGFLIGSQVILTTAILFCFASADSSHPEPAANTDRQTYTSGEIIRITLANPLSRGIYSHIRSATPVFCIQYVEKRISADGWKRLFAQCQPPQCTFDTDVPGEIKPGEVVSMNWNPMVYRKGSTDALRPLPGVYRLSILYQDCSRTEWQTVYTNEFSIQ